MPGVMKPCPVPGCPELVLRGRCPRHEAARRDQERERQRAYDAARPSSSQRGYGGSWAALRKRVLRDCPRCPCGAAAEHVDHILPLRRGGTNDRSNLQALCASCHSRKTATADSTFASRGSDKAGS